MFALVGFGVSFSGFTVLFFSDGSLPSGGIIAGIWIGAILVGVLTFFCVKFCIEKILPACIGCLCGCALLPIPVGVICVMVEVDPIGPMAVSQLLGCCLGCWLGPRIAKFLLAFMTAGYGSLYIGLAALIINVENLDSGTLIGFGIMCIILTTGGTIFQFKSYDEMLLAKICNGRTFESKYQNGTIVVVTTQTQARTNTINERDEEQESLRVST